MKKDFSWLIGGQAGHGIMVSGRLLAKVTTQAGLYIFGYSEYPSLIRGGHNSFQVRMGPQPIHNPTKEIDLLVALNQETFDLHAPYLREGAGIIFDPQEVRPRGNWQLFPIPLEKMAEAAGQKILRNTLAIGASLAALAGEFSLMKQILEKEFADKGKETVQRNVLASKQGFDYFQKNFKSLPFTFSGKGKEMICLTGNEAIALGAISAGCQFYSAYPMTPVSSILHFLALHGPNYGLVVKQAEDEIAVINTAIGASFAGVRSMTATSGGGFCLMTEAISLAAMTETPLVIVEGQRPAPATGLPTWTGQGDAAFVLHASHGDFPRIVLAPRNISECFYLTFQAFNLAERFQNPVIILVDELLCESLQSVPFFDTENLKIERGKRLNSPPLNYKRYEFSEDGISPRALPGQPGSVFLANSDEHDEYGFSSEEAENRSKMMAKRMKKMEGVQKEIPPAEAWGEKEARISLFSWGSSWGATLEAAEELQNQGIKTNLISFSSLSPFPAASFETFYQKPTKKVFVEANFSGQVAAWVREKTGKNFDLKILKDDGRPFYPEEIVKRVKEIF